MLGELNTLSRPSPGPGHHHRAHVCSPAGEKLMGQPWQCPLCLARAQPAWGHPVLLGLSILLLLSLPVLLPPSSPSHPQPHLLSSPWAPAVSQGGSLGQEGCVNGAQAHSPHLQHPMGSSHCRCGGPSRAARGKFSPSAIPGPLGGKHGYFYPS